MEQFTRTLTEFLADRVRPVSGGSDTREFRIFLASFPPDILFRAGREMEDFLLGIGRDVDFVFRIGRHLWDEWAKTSGNEHRSAMKALKEREWVDAENRLT